MIDLEAIAERDRAWPGSSANADCSESTSAEADRHALLEHIVELESITEEIQRDLRAVKALVRARTTFDPGPDPPPIARAEYKNRWGRANHLSAAQWRMLEELSERNKNPENEWRFGRKALATGARLVKLGLAKEHDFGPELIQCACFFSITEAGRARLAKRRSDRLARTAP